MRRTTLDRSALVWGSLFTVIGATFLLQELGVWRVSAEVLLPVLLIVAGAVLLGSGLFRGDTDQAERPAAEPVSRGQAPETPTPADGRTGARPPEQETTGSDEDPRRGRQG